MVIIILVLIYLVRILFCFCFSPFVAIVAGKSLKGKVVLNVQRSLPPGDLNIRLIGTEYTIISSRKGTK
jgi:hypothetical protein